MRTQRPRIYKQPGTGPKHPAFFAVGCVWFGWCLVSVKQPGSGPKYPKRQWPPPPFYLALWAILSVFRVPWSAGALTSLVVNACAACHWCATAQGPETPSHCCGEVHASIAGWDRLSYTPPAIFVVFCITAWPHGLPCCAAACSGSPSQVCTCTVTLWPSGHDGLAAPPSGG